MKRCLLSLILCVFAAAPLAYVAAHCEVPCGIYDDSRRFADMLEDQTTIAKAINGIHESTMSLEDPPVFKSVNQISRWIITKEEHATHLQHTVAQYFMTQRIKASDPQYVAKLTAAHKVMVAAMKCKQDAEPDTAVALEEAIKEFQAAYEKS